MEITLCRNLSKTHLCLGDEDHANCLRFFADGTRLYSGSWDGSVKVWNADTGRCEVSLYSLKDGWLALDEISKKYQANAQRSPKMLLSIS